MQLNLNTPLFIEDEYVKQKITSDPVISGVLEKGLNSDIILTGISTLNSIKTSTPWLGYMNKEIFKEIKAKDAVGCICAHFYDRD